MVGELATTTWLASIQVISGSPCTHCAVRNASLDLREPGSVLRWLFLPSSVLASATLALSPLLLVTILRSRQLRHKPHFVLLANILLSDLAYVVLHMLISSSTLGGWELGRIICGLLTDAVFAAYTSTILSFTATVLHTYLAVTRPLHYLSFVSRGAAQKAVACIWLVAYCFPAFLLWLGKRQDARMEEQGASCHLPLSLGTQQGRDALVAVTHTCILCTLFLCTALITYCFCKIFSELKASGTCGQSCSRARGTLLIHVLLMVLYVSAGLVFSLDIMLTKYQHIGASTHLWLLATNSQVFMMLPRALLPYLYVLRYRQLLGVVRGYFSPGRHEDVFSISRSCRGQSGSPRLQSAC